MTQQTFKSSHFNDHDDNPAGGYAEAVGIQVRWQDGPLGRSLPEATPEQLDALGAIGVTEETGRALANQAGLRLPGDPDTRLEPNGAFVETLVAIALDRVDYYQGSKFSSEYNRVAREHLVAALEALNARTADRDARQVEGTHAL